MVIFFGFLRKSLAKNVLDKFILIFLNTFLKKSVSKKRLDKFILIFFYKFILIFILFGKAFS
jgi:hypothetical protein